MCLRLQCQSDNDGPAYDVEQISHQCFAIEQAAHRRQRVKLYVCSLIIAPAQAEAKATSIALRTCNLPETTGMADLVYDDNKRAQPFSSDDPK